MLYYSGGDGPQIKLTSVSHDDDQDMDVEITSTVVRPGDSNMEVDIEGDDKLITTEVTSGAEEVIEDTNVEETT